MKSKNLLLVALFIGILMSSLSLAPLANAQPNQGAKFIDIKVIHYRPDGKIEKIGLFNGGTAKVYDNDSLDIALYFSNENITLPGVKLYTKIYIDNELRRTSENIPTPYQENRTDDWPTTLSGPVTQHWKVELWWDNNGENILEDNKEFDMWVVKLFVGENNWSPAPITVEKGKTAPISWSINFSNGGNDEMDNVSISIIEDNGLQITPTSQNFDTIGAGGTKSTSFSVKAPFNLPIGPRTVKFQITYYDFMGISHTETMSAPVIVDRLSTSITLSVDPSSVEKDSSTTITAQLVDGNGTPMANQAIDFSVENTSIGSATTDLSGNATLTYTANKDAGTCAINASFGGTADYYQSSTATKNLTVEPFKTTLAVDVLPSSAMLGDTVTIKATLQYIKDEKNNPLQNMDVEFRINENMIGSAKTDSSGIASIQYKTSTAGTLQVKAIFAGTTNYEASSGIVNLVVGESIALKLGITVVAVVIVVVALLFFARKRGMKIPFMGRKEEISPPSNPEVPRHRL